MLIDFDNKEPLFVLGRGFLAREWQDILINDEGAKEVTCVDLESLFDLPTGSQCVLAVLDRDLRTSYLALNDIDRYSWPSIVCHNAFVSRNAKIGKGCWIDPFCYVGAEAEISNFGCVFNSSSIGHNCKIGTNNVILPKTVLCGSVVTGKNVHFSPGATVRDKVTICDDVFFIFNSTVTKDVKQPGKYFGNRRI